MKRTIAALLLALWLGACTSSPSATQAGSTELASEEISSAESAPTENSGQIPAGREAVVSEFENVVSVRTTSEGEFNPAEAGSVIQQGGALQTGENGRARLDLMPEGTIIRIAPNSAFTLPQITETDELPKTTINLFFGKIFVLLNGGSLDVQTPSGVASVRGSLLSVSYDPQTEHVQATCLEGHCSLENQNGEEVELVEGESAYVDEDDKVIGFDDIDQDEVQEWVDEVPEIDQFLEEVPDPESYPEIEEFEEYQFDPSLYYEEQSTDDGSGFYWTFDEDVLPSSEDFENNFETEPAPTDDQIDGSDPEPTEDTTEGSEDPVPTDDPPTVSYP